MPPQSPRPPLGIDRTRRQLQELDELLQKMLALPIVPEREGVEDDSIKSERGRNGNAPAQETDAVPDVPDPLIATLDAARKSPLRIAPAEEPAVLAKRLTIVVPPSAPERTSRPAEAPVLRLLEPESEEPIASAPLDAAAFDLRGPLDLDVSAEGSLRPTEAIPADERAPETGDSRAVQLLTFPYRELVGLNTVYERTTELLGPLGRPLRSTPVKNFLGWLGIILLIAAAALSLGHWLGWTE